MNRTAVTIAVILFAATASAQLLEFALPNANPGKSGKSAARTQATLDPTFLPFFDDFSTSGTLQDTLWLYGQSVLLSNEMGIRPPSMNVLSFDGTDSLGKPYITYPDVLAKGFADRITSQPIRMDLVAPGDRPSVYFSFFYQLKGRGEPPDPGDQLLLAFKANDGTWENVHVLETSATMQTDTFQMVMVHVADDRFFHDNFQFRFFNSARLSGPYDTWIIDYVYLNKFRSGLDLYFPDRTISSGLTSLFGEYFSMPLKHFAQDVDANLQHPSLELYNLKAIDLPGGTPSEQPITYTTSATISSQVNGTVVLDPPIPLDNDYDPGILKGLKFLPVTLNTIVDSLDFIHLLEADSINTRVNYSMTTQDNEPISGVGDYDPAIYSPIDFRYNDTLSANYVLSTYYAYDDGTAEYGAGLNQAGSYLAFQFTARIDSVDTMTYVDIYFPEFGSNTNESLLLQVWNQLVATDQPPLIEQLIVVNRKTKNQFARYMLYRPVLVGGIFYVGWKQITNASIPVGLDKNTDSGDKVYYNTTGEWVQNTLVHGSMMVRPGFGKGDGNLITAIEPNRPAPILYPNPSPGVCTLKGRAERLEVYDVTGRQTEAQWETDGAETRITFSPATSGLVLVRMIVDGRAYTQKVLVKGPGR